MSADMIDYVLGCAESGATTRFAYENAMMARYQYANLRSDLAAAIAEAEALRAEKKQYRDRAIALRNQARAWRDTVYKTVLLD